MSQDRESFADQKELITDPLRKAEQEAANAVEQFDLVLAYVQRTSRFKLTTRIINELQEVALRGIHPLAGTFRNTPVTIRGSKHAPPDYLDVPDEVAALCAYVNESWDIATAVHLGAFILWKLNWIHPYADGNGRTARAVSYLVLSKKLGNVLPGTPTIPEQISVDKAPYYDALEAADAASNDGKVDVTRLEAMLEDMLVRQLLSRPSLPEVASQKLGKLLEQRLGLVSPELLRKMFDADHVQSQLWAIGDYVVLQVGSKVSIEEAENRQKKYRNPFPRLLAFGDTPHLHHLGLSDRHKSITLNEDLNNHYALLLDHDCFIAVRPQSLRQNDQDVWGSSSWLYIARLGTEVTNMNFPDFIDLMLAQQIKRSAD